MVSSDMDQIADVVFVIEGTAINGAYINDLKQNYIIPTLEYFSQGVIDERDFYLSDRSSTMYGIILYKTAQVGLGVCCATYGPFSSPQKVLNTIDRLELTGGRSESNANLAEGMATALVCFDDFDDRREKNFATQKHCILICNSPPYSMPVMDCYLYENKNVEQLASIFQEKNINLSILSPRKIPILFKIFEKAGGDLNQSTTKNYCKDPRHLVLLKGYSLKERPISPSALQQTNGPTGQAGLNINNLNNPIFNENCKFGSNNPMVQQAPGGGMGPRPQLHGVVMDQGQQQGNMNQQFVNQQPNQQPGAGNPGGMMQPNPMVGGPMGYMNNPQLQQQANMNRGGPNRNWMLQPPQQRQYLPNQMQQQQQQPGPQQNQPNSALISQLSTPPHPMTNQLGSQQMGNLNQQQLIRMQLLSQQQQQQQMVQNQQQQMQQQNNPNNMLNPGMQQQQQQQQGSLMLNQNQINAQQNPQMQQPQQMQQSQQMQQQNPNQPMSSQQQQQQQQAQQQQQGPPNQAGQLGQPQQQQPPMREKIWSGIIEWTEKVKNDQPKITRHVPCYVTSSLKDGELDIKADNWPSRLIMQLMPKQLIGNIGGQFLKDAKTVLFHPSPCESLDALSKVLSSGFAGCVHFNTPPNQCEIKILILLFTNEKKAFLGFIPNNQNGFVDRLRKVIAQKQGANRMGQGPPPQQQQQQQPQQQQGPPNLQPQVNMAVGGGNMSNTAQPQNPQMMQMVQPSAAPMNVPQNQNQQMQQGAGQRMGMINMPGIPTPPNVIGNPNQMQNMRGPSPSQMQQQQAQQQRFDFDQRQQSNMDKMSHLKQTLEQQVQQDFKGYDAYSQMPMQMQDTMQPVQQQQSQQEQYNKLLMMQQQQQQQQRNVGNMGNPQVNQINQQRMLRPMAPGNPGLRHLLQQQQQQPQNQQQYRQVMAMQGQNAGQMGGGIPRPQQPNPNNPQFDESFDFFANNE